VHASHTQPKLASVHAFWLHSMTRLPAARTCTNTSPGPRPSSSLAGTRESEQPILQGTTQGVQAYRQASKANSNICSSQSSQGALAKQARCHVPCFVQPAAAMLAQERAHHSHSGVCESTSLEKKLGCFSTCADAQRLHAGGTHASIVGQAPVGTAYCRPMAGCKGRAAGGNGWMQRRRTGCCQGCCASWPRARIAACSRPRCTSALEERLIKVDTSRHTDRPS